MAVVIALATYLAPSPSSPSFLNPPGTTQLLPDLGDAFTENPNGVNLQMKRVPGGFFTMGSPESEQRRYPHEGPQHPVTVPSFYIGKYEVTQAQWKAVMGSGNNPSYFKGDDLPVETVTWNDAKGFCRKLSGMTGKTYGLPSEAEWEYACRARTTGAFAGNLDVMAWYSNNSDSKTHPVGQKQANAFGLFDMHGNVWEWCEDVWHENYNDNPPTNGSAWLSGGDSWNGVLRGGSWYQIPNDVRSARRSRDYLGGGGDNGLRVVASARTQ